MLDRDMLDRDRFGKCLALAEGGATAGERAAGRAAAERIAASAGLTLAEAREALRTGRTDAWGPGVRRPYAWAQPAAPVRPITVEELLRQKAETEAWQRRATAAAGRRRRQEAAEQAAYEARQRKAQAERDRAWAQARGRDA